MTPAESLTFLTPYWSGRDMMRVHLSSIRAFYPAAPILVSKRGGEREEMEAHREEFGVQYWLENCEYPEALLRLLNRCETDYVCIVEHDTALLASLDPLLAGLHDGRWELVGMEDRVRDGVDATAAAPSVNGWWRFSPGEVAGPLMLFNWREFERRWGLAGVRARRSYGVREHEYDHGIGQKLARHKYLLPFYTARYGCGTVLKDGDTPILWHQWYGAYGTRFASVTPDAADSPADPTDTLEALARNGESAFLADYPALDLSRLTPAWGPGYDVAREQRVAEAERPGRLYSVVMRVASWRRRGLRDVAGRLRVHADRWRLTRASRLRSAVKRTLRRIPGLVVAYRHGQLLSDIARERWWSDPKEMNDRAIINREWCFEAPSEQERYQRVLAAVRHVRGTGCWGDVLEVGCAEGEFTGELVGKSESVTTCDVSAVACERTSIRWPRVAVRRVDIQTHSIAGTFDVIFAMCVLTYVHGRRRLDTVIAKIAGALEVGGVFVLNELRLHDPRIENCWWARWLGEGGLQLTAFVNGRHGLHLVHHEIHEAYVIAVYEKRV